MVKMQMLMLSSSIAFKMQTRFIVVVVAALTALAGGDAGAAERGGGLKVGGGAAGAGGRDSGRGAGVRVGGDGLRRPRTSPAPPPPPSVITAALVVPHRAFGTRDYTKAEKAALAKLPRKQLKLFSFVRLNITLATLTLTPSPMCK